MPGSECKQVSLKYQQGRIAVSAQCVIFFLSIALNCKNLLTSKQHTFMEHSRDLVHELFTVVVHHSGALNT